MGTWGPGNLESDGGLEGVNDLSEQLFEGIWNRLRNEKAAEWDEWEHDLLFVELEWLLALDDKELFDRSVLPREELEAVLDTWMQRWEASCAEGMELDPPPEEGPFRPRRRAVIEQTFARLRAVAAKPD